MNSDQQPYYRCPTFEATWDTIDYTGKWAQVVAYHKRRHDKQQPDSTLPVAIEEQQDKNVPVSTGQKDPTDLFSPYSKDEPKANINAMSISQDDFIDLASSHFIDNYKDMKFAVSTPHEHLTDFSLPYLQNQPNDKGFPGSTHQENFTKSLPPQINVEPEAKSFAESTRQQDFIQPTSPRFKQSLLDDTDCPISNHGASPPNVINLDPDTDQPPKYVSHRLRPVRRRQIPNYPHSSTPLPANIEGEEIITSYPNHLHGQTLLNLVENWTPSEIAETCPAKEINKGMISTRIKYARQRLMPDYQPRGRTTSSGVEKAEQKTKVGGTEKKGKGKSKGKGKVDKGKDAAIEAVVKEAESEVASMGSAQVVAKKSNSFGIAIPGAGYRRVNYRDPFDD